MAVTTAPGKTFTRPLEVSHCHNHSRLPLHLIQTHRAAPTEEISVFFQGYVPARRREDGRCPSSLIKSLAFADRQWLGTRNNSYNGYSMAPAVGRYPEIDRKST